jgi:hypothetical protein
LSGCTIASFSRMAQLLEWVSEWVIDSPCVFTVSVLRMPKLRVSESRCRRLHRLLERKILPDIRENKCFNIIQKAQNCATAGYHSNRFSNVNTYELQVFGFSRQELNVRHRSSGWGRVESFIFSNVSASKISWNVVKPSTFDVYQFRNPKPQKLPCIKLIAITGLLDFAHRLVLWRTRHGQKPSESTCIK